MKRCSVCATEYPDTFNVCPKDGAKLHDETVVVAAPTMTEVGATAPVSADFLAANKSSNRIGTTIAGRFRIETKLGEGGMGAVFKAEHIKMNRPCAIKILSASALNDPEALPRFTREAQMSSRIDHPHAVTIYDYGESEDGLVYLAMEYIEGKTLTDVMEADRLFAHERVIAIARQIGDALDAAHALGIVHRDLKPDNIMLSRKGSDDDFVKVLDFGIAKMAESEENKRNDLTQAGLIIGTPFYMSPEQVSGEKLDARSDVYSFALIVYEMFAGALPFEGQNTQAVMVSRLVTAPKPIRWINPNISPLIDSAVMRALERDRTLRTPTAGQFVRDLVDAYEGRVPTQPGGMEAVGGPMTAAQAKPDTVAIQAHPVPTPPQSFGQMIPPTDAHVPPGGYSPTAAEPAPWGVAPTPQHGGFAQQPSSGGYAQPAPKKGGKGVGIIIGIVLLLLVVIVGAGVGILGYTQGWFSKKTTAEPIAGPNGPTTGPSTGKTSDPATDTAMADAEKLFDEGYKLQVAGKDADAIEKYVQAIAKNPNLTKAHKNLGAAYVNTGRFSDAVKSLETAQQQDSRPDHQLLMNLGLAQFKLKQYQQAAESFEKAGPLGKDPEAYAYAGFAYDNAGNPSLAREAYTKYLSDAPAGELAPIVKDVMAGKSKAPTAEDFDG